MQSVLKTIFLILLAFCFLFKGIAFVQGAEIPEILHGDLPWPDGIDEPGIETEYFLNELLPGIIKWFLGFLASASIIVVMLWGYMILTAAGGDTKKGIKTITFAVIGLLVAILSYAIVSIIQNLNYFK